MRVRSIELHMREMWQPAVVDRTPWDEWIRRGQPAARARARAEARDILTGHRPELLACAGRFREIIQKY